MLDRLPNETVLRGMQGEYRLIGLIGRGGMGVVYRAERLSDGTTWALKEMRPGLDAPADERAENRELFLREARMLRDLDHPNIVRVVDLFDYVDPLAPAAKRAEATRPCMVMELVPGQTLERRLKEANAPLLEQQVLAWGVQLCRVLSYLHSQPQPIIYRDMKPANIMAQPDGVLKLLDFGVARWYRKDQQRDTNYIGTEGFAPPEQYGKQQTTARSDVYALGATLLNLLSNIPPVPTLPPEPGWLRKINPSVDAQTEQVILQAMRLDPEERFASAAEMEQALLKCLDSPYVDPVARRSPAPAANPKPPAPAPIASPRPPAPPPLVRPSTPAPSSAPPTAQAPAPSAPMVAPQPGGIACLECGRVNRPGARFCAGCRTPLRELPTPRLLISSPRGRWEHRVERVPCLIGRRDPRQNHYPQIDLAEHDKGIASRNHARIDRAGESYVIIDLGSTNGTTVNGRPLPPRTPQALRQGDRIKIGEVELEFRYA
jgi:serine/threonine protein kinase